jgi:hypothetical protein
MKKSSKKSSKKNSKKCTVGKILRSGFETKNGKVVPAGCIIAQSNSGEKTKIKVDEYLKKKSKIHEKARLMFPEAKKSCSKGYIIRDGYKVSRHKTHSKEGKLIEIKEHWVEPTCIKSTTGRSVKSPKLITILEKDVLKKYGYYNVNNLTKQERHKALANAIKDNKPLSIFRRVQALAILNKNKNPELDEKFKDDAKWIQQQSIYINSLARNKKLSKKRSKIN